MSTESPVTRKMSAVNKEVENESNKKIKKK